MTTTTRQVIIGSSIILEIDVRDARGNRVDPDSTPEVAIIDSHDTTKRSRSTTDVARIDEGRFRLIYTVPSGSHTGIWIDHWFTTVNGISTDARLTFIVLSQSASIDVSGAQIGDDPEISWSQAEINGLNILIKCLKNRLKNDVEVESIDQYGNTEFVSCPIFTDEEITWFLKCSLSEFNQTPHFSDFTFADEVIYSRFGHIIVEGGFILATAAQMLIEAGKEFTINDNGITMNPAPLSSTLNNELSHFVTRHTEMLKYIKNSLKPRPLGIGTFRVLSVSPNFLRLRHLRERRII